MRLADLLNPNAVRTPLVSTDKQTAINELVDAIASCGGCSDSEAVKRAVWERESQRSTGIGEGLAIPHGKCAAVNDLALGIGKPAMPMEFGSIDKKPVQLIVLLISKPEKKDEHIQALGKISKIMSSPQFRHLAYAATTPAELYDLFMRADS
ncbi:MAG: PTS sugar transporter subunit IIA [Phycisphaerales bacterium]|nr:PTS sugar transporter subunit IIA [Phycisphaerales bacterium]